MSEYQIVPRDEDNPVLPDPPEKPDGFNLVGGLLMNLVTGFFSTLGQLIGGTIKGVGKLAADVIEAAKEVAGGIARAIMGEGASMKEIGGAVDKKMGPIKTAVSESGERMVAISSKMDKTIRRQEELEQTQKQAGKDAKQALADAKSLTESVANYKKAQDDLARKYAKESKQLQNKLSGITTEQGNINTRIGQINTEVGNSVTEARALGETLKKISDEQGNLTTKAKKQMETVVEANKKVKDAVSEAEKASKSIENMVDIGASLVALIPGTDTPDWSRAAYSSGKMPDPPTNVKGVYRCNATQGYTEIVNARKVKAIAGRWYTYEFWAQANKADAALLIRLVDGEKVRPAIAKLEPKDNPGQWHTTTWGIGGAIKITKANEWQKFSGRFQLRDDLEFVKIDRLEWHWGGKGPQDAVIYVAGLKVLPEVPDQATVDRLQNNAILKNTAVGASNAKAIDVLVEARDLQLKWNDTQKGWNATQAKLTSANTSAIAGLNKANDLQNKWNAKAEEWQTTATTAMSANTNAIIALARKDTAQSLLVWEDLTEAEVKAGKREPWKPSWATATQWYKEKKTASDSEKRFMDRFDDMWGVPSSTSTKNCKTAWMRVEPGKRYKLSFFARAHVPGSRFYIQMWGKGGNGGAPLRIVTTSVDRKTGKRTEKLGNWTSYPVDNYQFLPHWQLVERVVEIREGVTELRFGKFYWNHSNGSAKANQWITGLEFGPDIPVQKDVDDAQNKAIDALQEADEAQERINAEQRKFNRLSQRALWSHQDMIELLDIRSPKVYGWVPGQGGKVYRGIDSVNINFRTNVWETPYVWFRDIDRYTCELRCRGTWLGRVTVLINWTNGAADAWTVDVTASSRIWQFKGGASHISMRSYTVIVYPRSLMREAEASLRDGVKNPKKLSGDLSRPSHEWDTFVADMNGLVRVNEREQFRLKNTVTCNRDVWVRDEENRRVRIPAGKPIAGYPLYPEDQDVVNTTYKFTEVDDLQLVGGGTKPSTPNGAPPHRDVKMKIINAAD
ncbi:hypothetical protein [Corynebacterium sp. MC3]|uniref:hypothetical protein n=1 Tax=Corynebacterium sp. MC3 TaxID=1720193 RepID=UPI0008DA10FD|nr:hypothetical protein [Corynebacterium sp. MC3]